MDSVLVVSQVLTEIFKEIIQPEACLNASQLLHTIYVEPSNMQEWGRRGSDSAHTWQNCGQGEYFLSFSHNISKYVHKASEGMYCSQLRKTGWKRFMGLISI